MFAVGTIGSVLRTVLPTFERATGMTVTVSLANPAATVDRVRSGAPVDLAIVANSVWDAFAVLPRVDAQDRHVVARTAFAAGLKPGSARVDIAAPDGLHRLLAGIGRLGLVERSGSTPKLQAGFDALGLATTLATKTHLFPTGEAVAEALVAGDVDLGITTASELLSQPAIVMLDALPDVIAPADTVSLGSVPRDARDAAGARALLAFLAQSDTRAIFARMGHRA